MAEILKPVKEGKVREIYDNGDSVIMVATDRISCFDVILKNTVKYKGDVLTQMSKFWFDYTKDILPNHMITTDTAKMPEFFRTDYFANRTMLCKKLKMIPVECVVRGYLSGSGWQSYKENGTVCGIELPQGLQESEKLPRPIFTPTTKEEIGNHDMPVTFRQCVEHLEKYSENTEKPLEETENALILYYGKKGEKVFDIARRYRADINFIVEENRLAEKVLTEDKMLFIPAFGM